MPYTQLRPVLVVEFGADAAKEHGRYRHAVRLERYRADLSVEHVPLFNADS